MGSSGLVESGSGRARGRSSRARGPGPRGHDVRSVTGIFRFRRAFSRSIVPFLTCARAGPEGSR